MKKPKINFLTDLKNTVTGLFKKKRGTSSSKKNAKRKHADEEDLIETLSGSEEDEDYLVEEEEDFIPQELSIDELKKRNDDELPDLPGLPESELPEEEMPELPGIPGGGSTSPSLNPMELPKSKNAFVQKFQETTGKMGAFIQQKLPGLKKKFPKLSGGATSNSALGKYLNNFDWDKAVGSVFTPTNRAIIHKGFLGTLLVAGTYSVGKLTALALKPKEKKAPQLRTSAPIKNNLGKQKALLEKIAQSDLFNAQGEQLKPIKTGGIKPKPVDQKKVCFRATKTSTLPVKLLQTVVLQDSVKSIASVQIRGKELKAIREGDEVAGMLKVGFVDRLRLVFKNLQSGNCEYIENAQKNPRTKGAPIRVVNPNIGKGLMNNKKGGISNRGNNF
ncbi:MAG: hypothetical protein HOM21_03340, partial [Halobacteriovoraceae bacterium]|nr:hypothetical protein [Halobacteriovoraceae bacterium]